MYLAIKNETYRLEPISLGGTAAIYKAVNKSDYPRTLTLKILKRNLTGTSGETRFRQERDILCRNLMDGIPRIFSTGRISGRPYITYEYINGITSLSLMQQLSFQNNVLTIELATKYLRQLLIILDKLHNSSNKTVHGDISHENLMISSEQIFLVDFGSAQIIQDDGMIPETRWIGKPSYLSPEQAQGIRWDQKSDIYQTGIIFYELLTGKRMNPGTTISHSRAFSANPSTVDFVDEILPIHSLLNNMLEPDPNNRPSCARDCLAELEHVH